MARMRFLLYLSLHMHGQGFTQRRPCDILHSDAVSTLWLIRVVREALSTNMTTMQRLLRVCPHASASFLFDWNVYHNLDTEMVSSQFEWLGVFTLMMFKLFSTQDTGMSPHNLYFQVSLMTGISVSHTFSYIKWAQTACLYSMESSPIHWMLHGVLWG